MIQSRQDTGDDPYFRGRLAGLNVAQVRGSVAAKAYAALPAEVGGHLFCHGICHKPTLPACQVQSLRSSHLGFSSIGRADLRSILHNNASGRCKMVASAHHPARPNLFEPSQQKRRATYAAPVPLMRLLTASLVALGASSLHVGFVHAEPDISLMRAAVLLRYQDRADGKFVPVKAASAMSRCLATWDRTSGMSKKVWKQTCKRVVKENPGLYSKPF